MDKGTDCSLMFNVSHKESYFEHDKILNFSNIAYFTYFQAAVSGLLAASVLYVEKKSKQILHNDLKIQDFVICQIAFLMRYFK